MGKVRWDLRFDPDLAAYVDGRAAKLKVSRTKYMERLAEADRRVSESARSEADAFTVGMDPSAASSREPGVLESASGELSPAGSAPARAPRTPAVIGPDGRVQAADGWARRVVSSREAKRAAGARPKKESK